MLIIDGVQIVLNGVYEIALRNEILDKCMFLSTLVRGTIPMNRNMGLDPDIISQPAYIAQQKYTIGILELIDQYEPRAYVEEVRFEASGASGNIIPKVVLAYNGE